MGAKPLVVVLAVAVLALATSLGWALGRGGDREDARPPLSGTTGYPLQGASGPVSGPADARVGPGTMVGAAMMGYAVSGRVRPVRTLAEAKRQAQRFGEPLGLRPGEVIEFDHHFYVELLEPGGERATEVLVDPSTGGVWLEHGPAMMWNTRYGMMGGGMMGGGYGSSPWSPSGRWEPAISGAQAEAIANRWLRETGKGFRAGEAEAFPGYYTLDILRRGRIVGMLSVNAFSGAVWYHWWHGRFVRESE